MSRRLLLAALALAAAAAGASAAGAADCRLDSAQASCYGCVLQAECGWCGASNECLYSDSAGPRNGTCASDFSWTTNSCPKDCSEYTECGSCSSESQCGWCESTRKCVNGTSSGPANATCASGAYAYEASQCTAAIGCAAHNRDCSRCQNRPGCGYCEVTGDCVAGSESGPDYRSFGDKCSSSEFVFGTASCPSNAGLCGQASNCGDCTPKLPCGWCPSMGQCLQGNSENPFDGVECPDWEWTTSECRGADTANCGSSTSCESCTLRGPCGWCRDQGKCVTAGSAGPDRSVVSCSDYKWVSSECDDIELSAAVWAVIGVSITITLIVCFAILLRRRRRRTAFLLVGGGAAVATASAPAPQQQPQQYAQPYAPPQQQQYAPLPPQQQPYGSQQQQPYGSQQQQQPYAPQPY